MSLVPPASVYTLAGGTKLIQDALAGLPVGPLGVVILIQIVWIILGCFIDWIGILLLTAPIFVPVVLALGFDPVWMGVLFCMNMQISYISPPFGPAAFYLKGVTPAGIDRKSTRLNSSHGYISYAVFCLKKKKIEQYVLY